MARILTGVQSTGIPHLGNLLGAVLPAIHMASTSENESFLFIADLHSITQIKEENSCQKILLLRQQHGLPVDWMLIKPFFIAKVM